MNKLIIVTACMLSMTLSACVATSVRGMREREPVLVADSARDAVAITNCVSEVWQKLGTIPRALPRSGGSTITVEQPGVFYDLPVMVLDVDTGPSGSHLTMRLFNTIWSKSNRARVEEVRTCL